MFALRHWMARAHARDSRPARAFARSISQVSRPLSPCRQPPSGGPAVAARVMRTSGPRSSAGVAPAEVPVKTGRSTGVGVNVTILLNVTPIWGQAQHVSPPACPATRSPPVAHTLSRAHNHLHPTPGHPGPLNPPGGSSQPRPCHPQTPPPASLHAGRVFRSSIRGPLGPAWRARLRQKWRRPRPGPAPKPTPPSRPKARAASHGPLERPKRALPSSRFLPCIPPHRLNPPYPTFPTTPSLRHPRAPPPPACVAPRTTRGLTRHPTTCPPLVHLPTPSLPSTQVWQRGGQAVRGVRRRWRWGPRPRRRGMPG